MSHAYPPGIGYAYVARKEAVDDERWYCGCSNFTCGIISEAEAGAGSLGTRCAGEITRGNRY